MKKLIKHLIVGVMVVGMLVGCGEKEPPYESKIYDVITVQERQLIESFTQAYSGAAYRQFLDSIKFVRKNKPEEGSVPFCDVLPAVLSLEDHAKEKYNAWAKKKTPYSLYKNYTGVGLDEACVITPKQETTPETVVEEIFPHAEKQSTEIAESTEVINEENRISAALIRELSESVGDCNIAKVKTITTLDTKGYLNEDDYNTIKDLISTCEMDKLRAELNK